MLDEAHGLSVLYLRKAHPLNVTLLSHIHLLLLRATTEEERVGWEKLFKITVEEMIAWQQKLDKSCCWFWPLTHGSRKQRVWCWPSLGQPPTDLSPHPDTGTGLWWCGEYGKTGPTSCGYRSSCRQKAKKKKKFQNYIFKAWQAWNIDVLIGQTPDSERLQPPQGPSLTANSTAFIVSHPVAELGAHRGIRC